MKYSKELMSKYLLTDRTCPELIFTKWLRWFCVRRLRDFCHDHALPKEKKCKFFLPSRDKEETSHGCKIWGGAGCRPENFLRAKLWDFNFLNHCVSDTWKFSCSSSSSSSSIGCIYKKKIWIHLVLSTYSNYLYHKISSFLMILSEHEIKAGAIPTTHFHTLKKKNILNLFSQSFPSLFGGHLTIS